MTEAIEEDDLYLDWDLFHEKHPYVSKWEWNLMQKKFQEV